MTRTNSGTSLVELIVVLAIVSLLSSLAYPAFMRYWVQGKRLEGRLALLRATSLLEKYAMINENGYLGATLEELGIDQKTERGWYRIHIDRLEQDYYQLRANPIFKDSECSELRCDSKGKYTYKGSGSYSDCWGNY